MGRGRAAAGVGKRAGWQGEGRLAGWQGARPQGRGEERPLG